MTSHNDRLLNRSEDVFSSLLASIERLRQAAKEREAKPQKREIQPKEYDECETHGRYLVRYVDEDGVERTFPKGCPKCLRDKILLSSAAGAEIPLRFTRCTFDNYAVEHEGQRIALEICRDYAENFAKYRAEGRCMILRGSPGTGKNHLATAIMLHIMSRNAACKALMLKAMQYLDHFWAKDFGERDSWLRHMTRDIDLLVIDEIGRSSNAKAAQDAFFRLIDGRYEQVRPTIIITNLSRDDLRDAIGDAAYDRLTEGGGTMVNFDWPSHRGMRATQ